MKTKEKLDPARVVISTRDYVTGNRFVRRGERLRANDPSLDRRWFVEDGVPESEWPSPGYDEIDVPHHDSNVIIKSVEIPVHRRVISQIDLAAPMQWAPGSIGSEAATRPPPFARTLLRKGQILDVLDPRVAQYPAGSFRWPERDVVPEDVERIARAEGEQAA